MTKAELIAAIAKECKISKTLSEKTINSFTNHITKTLKKGDRLSLTGFGTFCVSKRKARKGRNPQTGAELNIKARSMPKFKAGKELKKAVM